jgi:hypothetical protein
LLGLLVGSAREIADEEQPAAAMLDLHAAAQREIVAEPAALSFRSSAGGPLVLEQTVRLHNLGARRLPVSISPSPPVDGVEVAPLESRLLVSAGGTADVVVGVAIDGDTRGGVVATGELVVRVRDSEDVRLPWSVALPPANVDLLSGVALRSTGERITDATPAVVSFVAGAVVRGDDPEVRPIDVLEVELWRGGELLGVLSRRREVLPGRYAFGLTGRGPQGESLPRGRYRVRLVARPGDGTRRQVESVEYVVR